MALFIISLAKSNIVGNMMEILAINYACSTFYITNSAKAVTGLVNDVYNR